MKKTDEICGPPFTARNSLHRMLQFVALFLFTSLTANVANAQLSGSFTIGKSGHFKSFSAAVDSLNKVGVSGPVDFTADAGTFNEQISIPDITGASTTNTITFKGAGKSASGTLLTYDVISFSGSVVELNSTSNIIFRNIHIQQTNCTENRFAVNVLYSTDILFENCHIEAPNAAACSNLMFTWGVTALRAEGSSNNVFKNNRITGGSTTIDCNYYTTGYDVYANNIITGGVYNTVKFYEGEGIEFVNNIIDSADYNENLSFMAEYCSGIKVANNNIRGYNIASGMSFVNINSANNATPAMVYNNLINLRSPNTRQGVGVFYYMWTPVNADFIFAHNTINVVSAPYGDGLYVESENVTGMRILNNTITRRNGGLAMTFYYPKEADKISGNNYYNAASGDLIQYGRNVYTNVADYKTDAADLGHGLYDQSMDITFKSTSDLHVDQTKAAPWGPAIFVTEDIDGNTRCESFVTAGADESFYTGNANYKTPATPSFTSPGAVYYKNPVVFENAASVGKAEKYAWYINNKWVSDSMHLAAVLEGPTDTVKLVAYNCGGKDSSQTAITVNMPTSAPTTNFISNKSNIRQGEMVKLFDISSDYPSEWMWEISPKEVFKDEIMQPAYEYVYGGETSQNIYVRFLQGGKYSVCFTATNVVGSGNKECVTDYIEVTPSVNLGSTTKVTDISGWIYDNGGPSKPYQNAEPYKNRLVIGDCADSVYLVFKSFDLACDQNMGDYLRIYEGTNNRGRALHCTNNTTTWGFGPGFTGSDKSSCPNTCSPITATHTDTFKAKDNMYIEMQAVMGSNNPGFEAYYWVKPKTQAAPVAKFSSVDSVCINSTIAFVNESTGNDLKFLWDPDADGTFEALGKNVSYMYFAEGPVTIRMVAVNCGGTDTFSKTINVFLPKAPTAQFMADNINPTTDDIVFMTANVVECVDDYSWTFTSAAGKGEAVYMNGTSGKSANPQVTFTDTGCYSVTLAVSNTNGQDEVKLNCFIRVREPYCKPTVKTLSQDVGISEVQFGDYTNKSAQGETAFSDYTNTIGKAIQAEQGVTYAVNIKRKSTKHKVTRTIWIDWNYDGEFDNATEKIDEQTNSSAQTWSTNIAIPMNAQTGATMMRVAINQGSYTNKVCGRNEFGEYEDYRLYIRPDMTKPVITLIGDTTITFEQGTTYTDSGATAFDNLDGDITTNITVTEPINGFNSIPGTYYFRYNVKDAAENEAVEVLRKIVVIADHTAPELIIAGGDTVETILHSSTTYTPPAILRAEDMVDGDVSGLVQTDNPVKMNVVDTFTVTYTVTDMSKNTSKVVKTIIVKDTVKPEMVVYGDNPYYLNVGDAYMDWGVTLTDNYYNVKSLEKALVVTNNLNINVPGTYEYVYNVKDGSGNAAPEARRTIIVGDMVPPVVSIIGDTLVVVEVNEKYNDAGFNVTDNLNGNIIKQTLGTFYANFPNGIPTQLDTFHIVYTGTDGGNNSVSKTRYIVVKDQTEPVISLKGTPNATVCRWETYTDAGYDVDDNFYNKADIAVTEEGDWNVNSPSVEGPYSHRYKAVDKSGNVGYSDWRTIWVRSPYEFPCSANVSIGDVKALEKAISIYPNPNSGKFTVQTDMPKSEKLRFTVSNLLGQEVAVITDEMMNENKFQVDLSNQPAGVYLLNISTDHHTTTKRIVISK
ncbi:MAG: immunoglobulin-like domain-containing protein [Bacteroidia bacterium]